MRISCDVISVDLKKNDDYLGPGTGEALQARPYSPTWSYQ
jgi:hypothetical protein